MFIHLRGVSSELITEGLSGNVRLVHPVAIHCVFVYNLHWHLGVGALGVNRAFRKPT